jgi:hypothetical protein
VSKPDEKKRKSIHSMSVEELKRGEWRRDPELVAEYERIQESYRDAEPALRELMQAAIESMSDEEREEMRESLEDGTYGQQDIIRAKGEM